MQRRLGPALKQFVRLPNLLAASGDGPIAIDVETTGLDYLHDRPLVIGLASHAGTLGLVVGGQRDLFSLGTSGVEEFIDHWPALARIPLVFHNAKFDLHFIKRLVGEKWRFPVRVNDTYPLARMVEWQQALSLEHLARRYLAPEEIPPHYSAMKKGRKNVSQWPTSTLLTYVQEDARLTLSLFNALHNRVPPGLWQREMEFLEVLFDIEERGLLLNVEFLREKGRELRKQRRELEARLREFGIVDPRSRKRLVRYFMERYPDQLVRTAKGNVSVSVASLSTIDAPEARLVLAHRSLDHAISTWIDGFIKLAGEDGVIHCDLDQAHVISGRLACRRPNLQAIPIKERGHRFGSFRGMFKARPGFRLWEFDWRQAEYRLATAYAQENAMAELIMGGVDIHTHTAQALFPGQEIDRRKRQIAKQVNFATIYGVSPAGLADEMGLPFETAARFLAQQRARYPRFMVINKIAAQRADLKGYIVYHTGRRRFFGPDEETYKAFSQLIQGEIGELAKEAMLRTAALLEDYRSAQVLQIHDSLIVEIARDEERELVPAIEGICREVLPDALRRRTKPPMELAVDVEPWAGGADE